jgi:GNAT superfamily N-acetyltransferase
MLTARGYRLIGFEDLLGRSLDGIERPPTPPAIEIEPLAAADEATWLDVTVDGFGQPDGSAVPHETFPREALEAVFADIALTDGFRRYVARIDGRTVGGASMRIDGPIAQLCGAATLAEYRRRGVQTALLEYRLADARRAGCSLAVVTTQPGSKSQANSQRRGFALLYTRAVLVRHWSC